MGSIAVYVVCLAVLYPMFPLNNSCSGKHRTLGDPDAGHSWCLPNRQHRACQACIEMYEAEVFGISPNSLGGLTAGAGEGRVDA